MKMTVCPVVVGGGKRFFPDGVRLGLTLLETRRFGNGRCLPAGPLREPIRRLREVDFIVSNGPSQRFEFRMRLEGDQAVNLKQPTRTRPLARRGCRWWWAV